MGTAKTQVESDSTQASATPVAEQVKQGPEQHSGPQYSQSSSSPFPPPHGSSSANGAAGIMPSPQHSEGPGRAQISSALQRKVGNARMGRMISGLQAKVAVGEPGDRYEQEADDVANRIVSGQKVARISRITAGGLTSPVNRQMHEEEELQTQPLQRQAEEEEEPVQTTLQCQSEEEEPIQATLQRQAEEHEEVQMLPVQRQSEENEEEEEESIQTTLQQQSEEEEPEEEAIQTAIQRQAEEKKKPLQMRMVQPPEEAVAETQSQGAETKTKNVEGLQAKTDAGGVVDDASAEARIQSPGGGRPLPDGIRTEMEAGLGADFSGMRVHDTATDQADARSLNAKAFTHRDHIWLGPGASAGDRKLMAHELTHVVQQNGAVRRKPTPDSTEQADISFTTTDDEAEPSTKGSFVTAEPVAEASFGGTLFDSGSVNTDQKGFDQLGSTAAPSIQGDSLDATDDPPLLLTTDIATIETQGAGESHPNKNATEPFSPGPGLGDLRQAGIGAVEMSSVGQAIEASPQSSTGIIQREEEEGGLLSGIRRRVSGVVDGLSAGWGRLSEMGRNAVDGVRTQVGALAEGLSGLISAAVSHLHGAWSSVQQTAAQLTEGISNQIQNAMDSASGVVREVGDAILRLDGNALRTAWNRITGLVSNIRQGVQRSAQRAFQRVIGMWQALRAHFNGVLRRLAEGARTIFSRLQAMAQGVHQRLQSAWETLQSRAAQLSGVLGGILARLRSLVSRLISWGQRVWNGIRRGWNALRARVVGFAQQMRQRVVGLWQGLRRQARGFWNRLGTQWLRLQRWVRRQVQGLMSRVSSLWNELQRFNIATVIDAIIRYAPFLQAVREVAQNPDSVMRPTAAAIASTIEEGMPMAAEQQARQHIGGGEGGGVSHTVAESSAGGVMVQRSIDDTVVQREELRQPLDNSTIWRGFLEVLDESWNDFKSDLLGSILHILYEMIAVWDTIPRDIQGLGDDLLRVVGRMTTEGLGFWRHLIDIPLIIWRRINAILLHLFPWFVLISTVLGGLAGAGLLGAAGGVILGFFSGGAAAAPGAVAGGGIGFAGGAGLGFGFALGVGEALLVSYIAGELSSVAKAWTDLRYVEQTEDEQVEDLAQMVISAVGGGIALVLWLATLAIGSAFGAQIGRGLARLFRIRPGGAAARFFEGVGIGFRRGSPFRRGRGPRVVKSASEQFERILADPRSIAGKTPAEIETIFAREPGFEVGAMRHGRHAGSGLVIREVTPSGNYTGRLIEYHPGTPRHFGGRPYWKINNGSRNVWVDEAGNTWVRPPSRAHGRDVPGERLE